MAELWFLYTVLLHNVFHQCLKFQIDSFYSSKVMVGTKIYTKKLTKGNKSKSTKDKTGGVMVLIHCTSPYCALSICM